MLFSAPKITRVHIPTSYSPTYGFAHKVATDRERMIRRIIDIDIYTKGDESEWEIGKREEGGRELPARAPLLTRFRMSIGVKGVGVEEEEDRSRLARKLEVGTEDWQEDPAKQINNRYVHVDIGKRVIFALPPSHRDRRVSHPGRCALPHHPPLSVDIFRPRPTPVIRLPQSFWSEAAAYDMRMCAEYRPKRVPPVDQRRCVYQYALCSLYLTYTGCPGKRRPYVLFTNGFLFF